MESDTGHWEQFEQFRKKIAQECQSEEKQIKTRNSYTSLDPLRRSSLHEEQKPPILQQPSETDRIIKLRIENQELREQLKQGGDVESLKEEHAKQLKQQKDLFEQENASLKQKLTSFNDELEELKKIYKEKNMKLYNLVLQLEKEKQELIEKNISLLEQQSAKQGSFQMNSLVEERTRILAEQIDQLEERNAKLQVEKQKIEEKYMNLLQPQQHQHQRFRSSEKKPPIPATDRSMNATQQSFETLPPAQKSILKNPKLQLSASKQREKENQTPTNRSKLLETPKQSSKKPVTRTQSAQKKTKKIYSKAK